MPVYACMCVSLSLSVPLTNHCTEFIHLVAFEASDVCDSGKKKTIGGEHVLEALTKLGFGGYVPDVQRAVDGLREEAKVADGARYRVGAQGDRPVGPWRLGVTCVSVPLPLTSFRWAHTGQAAADGAAAGVHADHRGGCARAGTAFDRRAPQVRAAGGHRVPAPLAHV
jgi:hypothetical protein